MAADTFARSLARKYLWFVGGFMAFLVFLLILEKHGASRVWLGYLLMFATIGLYAGIGQMSRTSNEAEYFVAGRRVPAVFNGMATAADWMSAVTFVSLAGSLYLQGFDGLAYIVGWTGGFCLIAMLIGPYLRKFGQYTVPDFLAARYPGSFTAAQSGRFADHTVRMLAAAATIIVSFTYVVAQIYAVGLIASRFTGVDFSVGIFLGLASVLICSFLGGMRAVTWTQVAQYIIVLVAYLVPVMWLSVKHADSPAAQAVYGSVLSKLGEKEKLLDKDPAEQQVRAMFRQRALELDAKLKGLPKSWEDGHARMQHQLEDIKQGNASLMEIRSAERALVAYPKNPDQAERVWSEAKAANLARAEPILPHAQPFPGKDQGESDIKRNNFMALAFCLMMGTAALPHILMRCYTTSSVQETRKSVFWTLFFIMLLFVSVPALAVLVKYDIYTSLVGTDISKLPAWVSYWANIDRISPLISIVDVNKDGIVQLAEIAIDGDIVVLATPEIAGLPFVISGLVAAGGLAAALSTADGLLLAIANALSHDIYYKVVDPNASVQKRVTVSKLLLLVVAMVAAFAASLRPGDVLSMVGAVFSIASSMLFPALVLGVFWKRANSQGAIVGILTGFAVCMYYMVSSNPALGGSAEAQWFHIAPISAGVFGVPAGMLAMVVVSCLTPAPDRQIGELVDFIRAP